MKLTIPEGALDCLSAGRADSGRPSLVLVHGIQGTASVWGPFMAEPARDRLVLAPHLRGRAGSFAPGDPAAYTLAAFAGDLRAVLAGLPGPAIVLGWSMGCFVALEYLRRFGGQGLAGLALVSGSPCLAATGGADAVWFQGADIAALSRNAALRAQRLQLTQTATDIAVAGSWLSVQAADYRPMLGSIALPTLILHGGRDPDCPVAHARIMAGAIPGATLRIWDDCGHVPMAHDPRRFARELAEFTARCDALTA